MGAKRWTDEEQQVLRGIAEQGLTLIDHMHLLPGRTWHGARVFASKAGISFGWNAWTPEERDRLREIYQSDESIKVGLRRLLPHRSYGAAKGEAQRMGLMGTKKRVGSKGRSWVLRAIEMKLADDKQMTIPELVIATGASVSAIFQALNAVRGKRVHVGRWTRRSTVGDWMAVWELGPGPDAPRPPRKSAAASARDWKARKRLRAGIFDPFATLAQQVTSC